MWKSILLGGIIFSVLLASGALAGQPWPYPEDNLGIFSGDGSMDGYPGAGTGTAYLALLRMSCGNGLAGWECRLDNRGDAVITSVTFEQGIDADSELLGLAVGLGTPIPYSNFVVLAEIQYRSMGGIGYLYVLPNRTPSLPGVPVYVDGMDPMHKIPMLIPDIGTPEEVGWTFTVNYNYPTAATESTWGAVKGLYR